ncbi:MaoC family dehydratase [Photobacterium gaetbulicola]|uniref:MaoC family dehydratase n=1 Tax=Photobacterium gaetbulicola TaxID=1295392 RepID=UPI00068A513B|nr:MaoC/PaaZ C-terminal domain-containing protein [Photobacterium gaetbulicola]
MTTITIKQSQLPSSMLLLAKAILKKGRDPLPSITVAIDGFTFESENVNRYNTRCGLPQDQLPLPYLFVATQPAQLLLLTHPSVSLTLLGMIHTHVSFHQQAPLQIGKAYDFSLGVIECIQTEKGMEFELEGRFALDGVYQAGYRSRCLMRGKSPANRKDQNESTSALEEQCPAWTKLETLTLTPQTARGYAAVSGDYNPIHLHWLTAKPFGFKGPIIHGMYSVARMFAAIESPISQAEFTFRRPAFLPSTAELEIYEREAREGELRLVNSEGKPLVEAQYR